MPSVFLRWEESPAWLCMAFAGAKPSTLCVTHEPIEILLKSLQEPATANN